MSVTAEYLVTGMTCQHCVGSVTEEVAAIEGVTHVEVDLDSGQLSVVSDSDIPFATIAAAVDEAGYGVVGN